MRIGIGFVLSLVLLGSSFAARAETVVRPLPQPDTAPRVISVSPTAHPSRTVQPPATQAYATVCAQAWKDTKAAGALKKGDTYPLFMARCQMNKGHVPHAAPPVGPANPPATITALDTKQTKARQATPPLKPAAHSKPMTPKQKAARDRMRACGALWKSDKAAGRVPAGQTWPKYWSQCNTKLKKKK